jgi:4-amino-4-deoxy-L-arabinose transferase-like glycosyltransferase
MGKKKSSTTKKKPSFSLSIDNKKIFIVLLIFFIAINILNYDPKLFLGGDNAHYLILAKSLLSGQGYKDIFMPDSPPHTQYPPGFPALLIPGLVLFSNNFVYTKLIILFLSLGAFYLFYKFYKENLPEKQWVLGLLLFAFCPLIIMYSHYILSEIPYLFFSILAIYLLERLKIINSKNLILFLAMICALIFTYYIRTVGISLIIAALIYLIIKKRYKEFLILLVFAFIFIWLWQMRSAKFGGGGYFEQFFSRNPYDLEAGKISFGELVSRFFKNLKLYTLEVFPKILLPTWQKINYLRFFGLLSSGLVLIGFVSKLKKITVTEIYLILFLGITFAWPDVWTGDRFILPVVPLLFYYLILGIKLISKKTLTIPGIVIGFLLFFSIVELVKITPANIRDLKDYFGSDKMAGYSLDWQNYFKTLEWIKNNTAQADVVISRKAQFTYLIANRKSYTYPFSNDENKFFESLKKNRPQYILFDRFYWTGTTVKYLAPIINKYQDKFEVIYKTAAPEMYVLRIDSSLVTN